MIASSNIGQTKRCKYGARLRIFYIRSNSRVWRCETNHWLLCRHPIRLLGVQPPALGCNACRESLRDAIPDGTIGKVEPKAISQNPQTLRLVRCGGFQF